jgi:23S rRNA (pseudouridine1915-N3)-methyltransferase
MFGGLAMTVIVGISDTLPSMQKLTLLCIGSLKVRWAAEACTEYADRIGHMAKFDVRELPASKERDADRQRKDESARVLEALQKSDAEAWMLDEHGERHTSTEFSKMLSIARDAGKHLLFVLGGAYGLTSDVRVRCHGALRLSDMTLPHELCRVLFLEQVYRAGEIARGSGYHHD